VRLVIRRPVEAIRRMTLDQRMAYDLLRAELFGWTGDMEPFRVNIALDYGQQMADDSAQDPRARALHTQGCAVGWHWRMTLSHSIIMQTTWTTLFPQTGA
jgi:hypothetical protein